MKSFWALRVQLVLLIAILLGVMVFGTGLFLSQQAEDALIREKTEKMEKKASRNRWLSTITR